MSGISAINRINTTSPYLYGHIASGNRLMSAADGASDLAIVEKEKSQVPVIIQVLRIFPTESAC